MSHHHNEHAYEKIPTQDHSDELGHVQPIGVYWKVFAALVILTIITVAVAQVNLGAMNMVVAMVVASIKAMLVALFFMHLKYEKYTTWLYAAFPLILLAILIGLLFIDNPYRAHPNPVEVVDTLKAAK